MSKTQVITGVERRRRFSNEEKAKLVAEAASTSLSEVSRKHAIALSVLSTWRKKFPPRSFSLVEVTKPETKDVHPASACATIDSSLQTIRVFTQKGIVVEFPLTVEPVAIAHFVKALEG